MILDENLFEEEKELPKKQPRYFAKEVNGKGYVYDRKFSTKVPSNVDKDIATARASVKRWNKEEPITEGKNLDDIVYDKLSRIKLSKGKDGKPRHPEVYANPKGNGFKLELDDEVGIDQAAKIAKEHGLNHNVKKVRDYIEVTIDTPERKAFTETYSISSLEQEIRNKVRDTFPNFADDEYAEYIGDYLVVEIIPQDGRTKVEVRADLTYKMMDKIADNLNPIVQKLDKDAYFDHEDTGIINAFINSKDLKESAHKTKLAEWVSNFRKKSLTESTVDYSNEEYLYKPYWYFTTHGVMPGSVPKYVQILGVVDADNGSYFATDRIIHTKDLREYEIIEKAPELDIVPEKVRINIQNWIENPIEESLMQDIQADHARVRDEYGQEVYDALEEYTSQGNDLGKVLYSEDGWKAFEEFCKGKGIEIVSKSKPFTAQVTESTNNRSKYYNWSEYLQNCKFDYALSKLLPYEGAYIDNELYQKIQGPYAQWQLIPVESEELVSRVVDIFGTSITESFEDEHLGNSNFKSFIDNFIETHKALIKSEQQRIELLKQRPDSFNVNVEDEIKDAEMRIQEHQKKLNEFEKLKVNGINESIEETPEPGPEAGIASLINKLIVDEWEAIQGYNDAIVAAETEGYSDIANVLRDIANEENLHVGQLEQVMQQLSPNAESINQGEVEAEGQLNTTTETSEDPEEGMHY